MEFQSTLLRKERRSELDLDNKKQCVSIHAPTKGATINSLTNLGLDGVAIHAPTKGATRGMLSLLIVYYVSIHAPTKGATHLRDSHRDLWNVSIHAPTKGATIETSSSGIAGCVSIHAPTKGATQHFCQISSEFTCFNPRSYERSDVVGNWKAVGTRRVSIHAPTKGATWLKLRELLLLHVSIHAPTKGATFPSIQPPYHVKFQSTLLRKERPGPVSATFNCSVCFNPRSYERSDHKALMAMFCIRGFNPRSYERSDASLRVIFSNVPVFQSTLLRKERQQFYTNHHLILFYF